MNRRGKIITGAVTLIVLTATAIGGYKFLTDYQVVHAFKNASELLKKFPMTFKV